ncbi:MAG TPA: hypothetical protein VNN79_14280 [Actinomycetota bacterium]|nr:hypothetical protein [Actinomycetota bacterium]
MPEPVVQVEGARELRAALKRLGEDLEDFKDIHAQVASQVIAAAGPRIRSRSGRLAGSSRAGSAKTNATVRYGGARIPYAAAVHWGTGARRGRPGPHNITPNRFVVDAAHDTEPAWTDLYYRAVQAKVDDAISRSMNE